MIDLAFCMWLEVKGELVDTNVIFVSELEPRAPDKDFPQRAMSRQPSLPRDYGHEFWYAGSMQ